MHEGPLLVSLQAVGGVEGLVGGHAVPTGGGVEWSGVEWSGVEWSGDQLHEQVHQKRNFCYFTTLHVPMIEVDKM